MKVSLLPRVKVALAWRIEYYLAPLAVLFITVLLIWVTVALLERFKLIPATVAQAERT
jgi:hypothetical protein